MLPTLQESSLDSATPNFEPTQSSDRLADFIGAASYGSLAANLDELYED
ncbi:MAG: hypothetical protein V7L14_20500 [Nostoc sp.]